MFLVINEIRKEKTRFILIILIVVLVGYLTFFLTALAYGLATSYTQGIDKWKASGIVLQRDANNALGRSLLLRDDYKSLLSSDTALLGNSGAVVEKDDTKDVALFGIDMKSFLAPNITDGRMPQSAMEVIVGDELKDIGYGLGQSISYQGSDRTYTIVGFTDQATFQTSPIIYMDLNEWRLLASDLAGMSGMKDQTTVSAVVTKGDIDVERYNTESTTWQSIRDFSFELPGYQAQVLTFSLMIGFLIAIASFMLAIFMYILTLQKKSLFGVLKAEGVSSAYIGVSVIIQTLMLLALGLVVGLVFAVVSGVALAPKVPFLVNWLFFTGITLLFFLFSVIGAVASVRAINKIDPVEAIG